MKLFTHPIPIACLILAIIGAIGGSPATMALAIVVGVASIGILSAREAQGGRKDTYEELSAEARILIQPVKKLAADIEKIIKDNKESQTIQIIGVDALTESTKLLAQVSISLKSRDDLKKSLKGRAEAERAINDAQAKLPSAGDEEKASLNTLIDARKLELTHYGEIERQLKHIEVSITQAEAALAEMKARLSLSASTDRASLPEGDDLRETIGRLKNLNDSYEESARVIDGL